MLCGWIRSGLEGSGTIHSSIRDPDGRFAFAIPVFSYTFGGVAAVASFFGAPLGTVSVGAILPGLRGRDSLLYGGALCCSWVCRSRDQRLSDAQQERGRQGRARKSVIFYVGMNSFSFITCIVLSLISCSFISFFIISPFTSSFWLSFFISFAFLSLIFSSFFSISLAIDPIV